MKVKKLKINGGSSYTKPRQTSFPLVLQFYSILNFLFFVRHIFHSSLICISVCNWFYWDVSPSGMHNCSVEEDFFMFQEFIFVVGIFALKQIGHAGCCDICFHRSPGFGDSGANGTVGGQTAALAWAACGCSEWCLYA